MNTELKIHSVAGSSMLPLYKDGDILTGRDFDGILLKGSCYGFYYRGNRLFHRFVCFDKESIVFSGDNTNSFESVPLGDVFFTADDYGPWGYQTVAKGTNYLCYKLKLCFLHRRFKPIIIKRAYNCNRFVEGIWKKRENMKSHK